MFAALRNRDFRLFWTGAFVSNVGSWLQQIALSWLVLQLTNSPFALGLVSFAGSVPILLFSLFGGVFVDRFERRPLLLVTQSITLVLALLLAIVTQLGIVSIEQIIIISVGTGLVMALNAPAWQAFINDIVPDSELYNAIALNSTQFNLSRVVGPSLAGIAIAVIGAAGCFFLNSASFVAVIIALILIRPKRPKKKAAISRFWAHLVEGLAYVFRHPIQAPIVGLTMVVAIFGLPYALLMPVMARDVLNAGASGYGALMAAMGVGAIIGSLGVAGYGRLLPRGRLLLVTEACFGVTLLAFSLSRVFWVAALSMALLGLMMITYMTVANTVVQFTAPPELRGRVMSIWTLVSFGFQPLGSVQAGAIAQQFGAPVALGLGGVVCLLAALFVTLRYPLLRRLHSEADVTIPPASRPQPAT